MVGWRRRIRADGADPCRAGGDEALMVAAIIILVIVLIVVIILLAMSIKVVKQYEQGVVFRLGRLTGARAPGLRFIIPVVDVLHRVSLRIVTLPIQSQGIITRDNVSVDVSAVAYFRVVDAGEVGGRHRERARGDRPDRPDHPAQGGRPAHAGRDPGRDGHHQRRTSARSSTCTTLDWGVEVTLVELKDIQLPDSMKRAMARQAEAEREKRAKIIAAEGESLAAAALGEASDTMMAHPLALQLRNLQSLVEIGVDKNTDVVFPAPLMSTIGELGSFLARESAASSVKTPDDISSLVQPSPEKLRGAPGSP